MSLIERLMWGMAAGAALLATSLAAGNDGFLAPYLFNMGLPYLIVGVPWQSWAARNATELHQAWLQALVSVGWIAVGTPLVWAAYYALLPAIGARSVRKIATLAVVGAHLGMGITQVQREMALYARVQWHNPSLDAYVIAYILATVFLIRASWTA